MNFGVPPIYGNPHLFIYIYTYTYTYIQSIQVNVYIYIHEINGLYAKSSTMKPTFPRCLRPLANLVFRAMQRACEMVWNGGTGVM